MPVCELMQRRRYCRSCTKPGEDGKKDTQSQKAQTAAAGFFTRQAPDIEVNSMSMDALSGIGRRTKFTSLNWIHYIFISK